MSVRAVLADGTVLEFPDGTDPTIIASKAKEITLVRAGQKATGSSDPAALLRARQQQGLGVPDTAQLARMYPEEAREDAANIGPAYEAPEDNPVIAKAKQYIAMRMARATPDAYPGLFIQQDGQQRMLSGQEIASVLQDRFANQKGLTISPRDLAEQAFGGAAEGPDPITLSGSPPLSRSGIGANSVYDQSDQAQADMRDNAALNRSLDKQHAQDTERRAQEATLKPNGSFEYYYEHLARALQHGGAGINKSAAIILDSLGANEAAEQQRKYARIRDYQAGRRIAGETTEDDVWQHPTASKVVSFLKDQGVEATPTLAAAVFSLPLLVMSMAGNSADERARLDGRSQADLLDLVKVLPTSVVSAYLDRLPLSGATISEQSASLVSKIGVHAAQGGIGMATADVLTRLGEGAGTEQGPQVSVKEAILSGLVGGTIGGAAGGFGHIGEPGRAAAATDADRLNIADNASAVQALDPNSYNPDDQLSRQASAFLPPQRRLSPLLRPSEEGSPIAGLASEWLGTIDKEAGDIFGRGEDPLAVAVQHARQRAEEARQAAVEAEPVPETALPVHGVPAAPTGRPSLDRMINITLGAEGGGTLEHPKTSPKGAHGPMQVMPDTARDPGHGIRPSDGSEADTARVGRELLQALTRKYGGDPAKAWAAYNWGEGHVDGAISKYGDNWLSHAPDETKGYVRRNVAALGGRLPPEGGGGRALAALLSPDLISQFPEAKTIPIEADHSFVSLPDEQTGDVLHGVVNGNGDFRALEDILNTHTTNIAAQVKSEIDQMLARPPQPMFHVEQPSVPATVPSGSAEPGGGSHSLPAQFDQRQPLRPSALTITTEPGNGQLGKGVIPSTAPEDNTLVIGDRMPERRQTPLDQVPVVAISEAYTALEKALPMANGRFALPSGTTGAAIKALMQAGVDINARDLTVSGPDIRTIQQHGLEEFAKNAPVRQVGVADRGAEAPAHQRYMVDHGDGSFGLGATPEEARADSARATPQQESFAQRSDPGQGKWISNLYEGVRGLGVKNATVSEWLNHIYDEPGNRVKLPGVKVDELKETGMLAALKQIASDHGGRVSKEDFLSMVDGLLPHVTEHVLDDGGLPLSASPRRTRYKGYTVDGFSSNGYEERVLRLPQGVGGNPYGDWRAGHFGERGDINSNPVVHFRTSMKEGPNGEKTLFVEEMQSDLHSEASDRAKKVKKATGADVSGYREPVTDEFRAQHDANVAAATKAKVAEIDATIAYLKSAADTLHEEGRVNAAKTVNEWIERARDPDFRAQSDAVSSLRATVRQLGLSELGVGNMRLLNEMRAARGEADNAMRAAKASHAVISEASNPMAPVRAPWAKPEAHTRLAMRRVIQIAAEKGADRVVWIHGDQQNGGRVEGGSNGDWYYGERGLGGMYRDKEGNLRPAIVPTTVDKLIKPMGGKVRHDIGVKLESAIVPGADLADRSEFEYMAPDDLTRERATNRRILDQVRGEPNSLNRDLNISMYEDRIARVEHALADKEGRNAYSGFDITPQMRAEAKRGMPLFKVGDAEEKAWLAEKKAGLANLREGIRAELEKRGVADSVRLRVDSWLEGGSSDQGKYTPAKRLMEIAAETSEDPYHTARHELIHHLRTIDVIKRQEWLALQQRAKMMEKEPGQTYLQWAEKNYKGKPRETQVEEAIAEMSADFITKRADMGKVEKIIAKIGDVIAAMGDAWRSFTGREMSGGKVLRDIEAGKVGSRGEGVGDMGDRSAFDVMDSLAARRVFTPSIYEDRAEPADKTGRQVVDMFKGLGTMMKGQTGDQARASAKQFAENWVDNMVGWHHFEAKLAQQMGSVPESASVYLRAELMKARAAARIEKVAELMKEVTTGLKRDGLDFETFGKFLALRHAPHRDAKVAAKNPIFRARAPDEAGGSGYSQIEQQQMEADLQATGKWQEMEKLADIVDALNQYVTMEKQKGGLLSQEQVDAGFQPDEHYVPLKGHSEIEEDVDGGIMGGGRGVMVRGRESKLMAGREYNAPEADILPHVFAQAQASLIRIEKNRVGQALHELQQLAPDPEMWKMNQATRRPYLSGGEIKYRMDTNLSPSELERSVGYKIDGVQHYITFNESSDIAMRLASEIRNQNAIEFNGLLALMGKAMHSFKSLRTQYSPTFLFRNMWRDLQEGVFNLLGTELKNKKLAVLKDGLVGGPAWREAMAAQWRDGKHGSSGPYGQAWDEYVLSGGPTQFSRNDPVEQVKSDIKHHLDPTFWDHIANTTRSVFSPLSKLNEGQENALRFASFYRARQEGLSADKAASIAKNITVNFERHGNYGPSLNLAYAFANPNIQGNTRLLITASRAGGRALRVATSMALAGAALTLYNQWMSDKDDDGKTFWDKVPDWQKQSNWIIMTPGKKTPAITIPKAWGIGVFPNIGQAITEVITGKRSVASAGGYVATTIFDAFNPVGGNRFWNVIAPTLLDPIADLNIYNAEFSGKKIEPDQLSPRKEDQVPKSQLAWPNTPFMWKASMQFLNRATGGDEVKSGAIDVSPDVAHYWAKFMTGSAGEELERMFVTPIHALTGKEVTANDIPMVRAMLMSKTSERAHYGSAREHIKEALTFYSDVKKYVQHNDDEAAKKAIAENPELVAFYDKATFASKQLSIYNSADRALQRAAMNKGGVLDERGVKAIGALYGMKPKQAVVSIPNNPTPDQIKAVREVIKSGEADLISQLNKSWEEEVAQARKKRKG